MSSENMKTCANCGNEVREGARFCASCGAAVAPPAAEPSRAEPPPRAPSSGGKGRLLWVAAAAAVALLVAGGAAAAVLAMTGGDGPSHVLPPGDETSSPAGASGVDCDELTSLVNDFSGLSAAGTDPIASADNIEEVTAALSEFASKAPKDVQEDLEAVLGVYEEIAQAVSDLGLEPGDTPDAEQQQALLELVTNRLDDAEFFNASLNVADWFETAVAQCSSFPGTETTDSSATTFGDETTTEAGAVGGDDVDETCAGFVTLATLTRADIPDPSVDDVESIATIASELASNAPAESFEDGTLHVGQPKQSLDAIAQGVESYARLLSELGLEPGSDAALAEPRIAVVLDGIENADADLTNWFEARCSEEDKAAFERIRNG